jgi:hypothetical protein
MASQKCVKTVKITKAELFVAFVQAFGWAITDIDGFQWDAGTEQLIVTKKEEEV